jgi:hypothetical protein
MPNRRPSLGVFQRKEQVSGSVGRRRPRETAGSWRSGTATPDRRGVPRGGTLGGKIVARPASGACSPAPSRLANGHQNSPAFTSSRGSRGNSLRPAGALRSARTPEIHQILEQALPTPRVTGAMMIVTRPPASPADRAWRARCAAHPHAPGALLVASDSVATQSQQRRSGCPRGR